MSEIFAVNTIEKEETPLADTIYVIEFSHTNTDDAIETESVWTGIDEELAHQWIVDKYHHWLSVYDVSDGKFTIVSGDTNTDELSIHWTYVCVNGELYKWVSC